MVIVGFLASLTSLQHGVALGFGEQATAFSIVSITGVPEMLALPVGDMPPPPALFTVGPGLAVDLIIVVAMVFDWRTRGRPHPAYLIGGGIVLATQLLRVPLSTTAAWRAIANGMLALAAI